MYGISFLAFKTLTISPLCKKTLAKEDLCFADSAGLLGLPGQNICSMPNASREDVAKAVEEAAGLGCEET